jgi:hypothetical protein
MKPKTKTNLSVLTILDVMDDDRFFGRWFRGESWRAWRVFLCALFALPMDTEQLALYQRFTGRTVPSPVPFTEAWVCVGRRGGKSLIAALVVVYLAFFRDYTPFLAPGEIATVMVLAADRKQARTIMRYTRGFINAVPMLAAMMIGKPKRESIELTNRVAVEIHTAGTKTLRGYTCAAVMNDEIAFWNSDDSAEPARETLVAQRPSLSTIPGAMLLNISTAGGKHGIFYESITKNFGNDDSGVLSWRATSVEMNSKLDAKTIEAAYEADPVAAAAEYGSEFRSDLATFVSREAVEACVIHGRRELPRAKETQYVAFCDPSGGSNDSMTLGIAHLIRRVKNSSPVMNVAVLDALREIRPPFSPDSAVVEFCEFLRSYGISEVHGDRYAGAWVSEQFSKNRVVYSHSEKTRSEIYLETLPLLNSGRVELLDDPRLFAQICALERRISVSGKDSVDHPRCSHDDLANAAAGALVLAAAGISQGIVHVSCGGQAIAVDKFSGRRGWTALGVGAR